jgi:polysaccharide pyruvyl transferase WcaK-like protein
MQILIDNGTYALENMGDVIMLQGCVARMRHMWPEARIGVYNRVPGRLARYCPQADPVSALSRDQFVTPGAVLGKINRVLPGLEGAMRTSAPGVSAKVVEARVRRRKLPAADVPGWIARMESTDLHVTSGGGYITDEFAWLAERILRTLLLAQSMGKRTAMLGQGLGPLKDPKLRKLAARAFGGLDLLTLREGRSNLALLKSLGVPTRNVVVTGDDAIESARQQLPHSLGNGIGVNLRKTRYSGATDDTLAKLKPILHAAAEKHGAPLVPVPISYNDSGEDVRALRTLLDRDVPDDESVQLTELTVAAAASCRIMVTGAYHAAVFALSNGVPAIGLAGSPYYVNKFEGLREQFQGGCTVVRLDEPGWPDVLAAQMDRVWNTADALRPNLLAAGARQIKAGQEAYGRLKALFSSSSSPSNKSAAASA